MPAYLYVGGAASQSCSTVRTLARHKAVNVHPLHWLAKAQLCAVASVPAHQHRILVAPPAAALLTWGPLLPDTR